MAAFFICWQGNIIHIKISQGIAYCEITILEQISMFGLCAIIHYITNIISSLRHCHFLWWLPVTYIISLSGSCQLLRCHACWLGQGSGTHLKHFTNSQFKSFENRRCSYIKNHYHIRPQFCTNLDSTAIVARANLWPDWMIIFPIKSIHLCKISIMNS